VLAEWAAFERWYGPILIHERIDHAAALGAFVAARAAGNKDAEFKDFIPDWSGRSRVESEDVLLAKVQAFAERMRKKE